MHYLKFGNSKNFIVFLHGWGADLNSFLWLKDYFENDYSLVFLDFAGFGKSLEPSIPRTVQDYAYDLKMLLDEFEIETLTFVAHSFGGRVAIKFLFNYQTNYNKVNLCLIDSAGILPKRGLCYKVKVRRYKRLKERVKINPNLQDKLAGFGSDDYKKLSIVMKQTFINVVNEDLSRFAKFIDARTIIVWGEKDKETKLYMARKLNKLIRGSQLFVLKGVGHFSFLEKREDFLIILDSFLKNL